MNARARVLSAVLLASCVWACASSPPSPPVDTPTEAGSPARLWQRTAMTGDLARFTRDGTRVSADGALELDPGTAKQGTDPFPAGGWTDGGSFYNGGAFHVGTATSELQSVPGGFDSVVPSFDAQTPPGTWVKLTVAARIEGTWTKDYELGIWAFDTATVARHSVDGQGDGDGNVLTDTLNLKRRADALRVTVSLFSERPGVSPRVRALAAALTDTRLTPQDATADRTAWGTVLDVPGYSQMVYPDGGEVWCSPTSTTMLLGYWGRKLHRADLEHPVPTAAAHTYDWVYKGTGNWSFNTAYAAHMADGALHGLVARFDSFAPVERLIAAGIPVSISIAYEPGELPGGAARRTDGHLIVVKGFTATGDVVVNDPAFSSNETTGATYPRAELWRAWQHSRGAAYVLWPAGTALPAQGLTPLP
ncbi:C39 family peptidase [Corallococcus silvisoli]|uniref:C39 family peptidase n=1 Tax=Corallococcus silvisoli TaxID=2697031 RepID=UPI001376E806|nr:C39 family peptidase [Corallococcus silvisoli]NBD07354.1 peptidase C39 family protein [Corallococcus silvisoli]